MSDEWVIRASLPDDEPCLAHMWIRSMMHLRSIRQRFGAVSDGVGHVCRNPSGNLTHLHCDACDYRIGATERPLYWSVAQPVVTAMLRSKHVRVLVACSPDRVQYTTDGPAIILGFSVYAPSSREMLWVGVKASVLSTASLAAPLVADLLPDVSMHDARISAIGMFPDVGRAQSSPAWLVDDRKLHHLLDVSYRRLHPDAMTEDVSQFILDPTREVWQPREERAA